MKRVFSFLLILFAATVLFAFALPVQWKIAEGYNITFSTSGVSGIFRKFSGTVVFDEKNIGASKFDVTIDVASINTGNGLQNKHAKGDDWFDAEKFPTIRFVSKKIGKTGAGYLVTGDLQMHGKTKELSIPFSFKNTGAGGVFAGSFTVNRNDFAIGKPGGEVGEVIKLSVSVPVQKN